MKCLAIACFVTSFNGRVYFRQQRELYENNRKRWYVITRITRECKRWEREVCEIGMKENIFIRKWCNFYFVYRKNVISTVGPLL